MHSASCIQGSTNGAFPLATPLRLSAFVPQDANGGESASLAFPAASGTLNPIDSRLNLVLALRLVATKVRGRLMPPAVDAAKCHVVPVRRPVKLQPQRMGFGFQRSEERRVGKEWRCGV